MKRNCKAFMIPVEKYNLLDNMGDGHCVFYVWMQILSSLGDPDFTGITEENRVEKMLSLRQLVHRNASDSNKREKMIADEAAMAYMFMGTTTDADEDTKLAARNIYWNDCVRECYDPDLPIEEWAKFDPAGTERHRKLQGPVLFVGALLMEHYKHYKFRVITFRMSRRLKRWENADKVAAQFLPPHVTQVLVADSTGEKVWYALSEEMVTGEAGNKVFRSRWDDRRTIFLFMDASHVNMMVAKGLPVLSKEIQGKHYNPQPKSIILQFKSRTATVDMTEGFDSDSSSEESLPARQRQETERVKRLKRERNRRTMLAKARPPMSSSSDEFDDEPPANTTKPGSDAEESSAEERPKVIERHPKTKPSPAKRSAPAQKRTKIISTPKRNTRSQQLQPFDNAF
jgi:hypothetical protein